MGWGGRGSFHCTKSQLSTSSSLVVATSWETRKIRPPQQHPSFSGLGEEAGGSSSSPPDQPTGTVEPGGQGSQNSPGEERQAALSPFAHGAICRKEDGEKMSALLWRLECPVPGRAPPEGFKVVALPVVRRGRGIIITRA